MLSLAGCQVQIDPRGLRPSGPGPDPDSPLIGTSWFYDAGWEAVTLYFISAETVLYNEQYSYAYSYDKPALNGQADSLGSFTVTGDYEGINFPQWKQYPHGAEFTRVKNQESAGL